MTQQEKTNKIAELSNMIVDLKTNPKVNSKKTIQKLQQQIDALIHE